MSAKNGLRARREAAGLGREKLAQQVPCSTSTIILAERGGRISEAMAQRIADALGCQPAQLFEPAVVRVEAA